MLEREKVRKGIRNKKLFLLNRMNATQIPMSRYINNTNTCKALLMEGCLLVKRNIIFNI